MPEPAPPALAPLPAAATAPPRDDADGGAFFWRDEYALGHAGMDAIHREFVDRVAALLTTPDDGLAEALEAFGRHARAHFAEEDRQMAATRYGNAGCHVDEHAKVLKSFEEVRAVLAQGRRDVVRSFAIALADWFPGHAQVMDQGLARWLSERELGGSPVTIRRRAPLAA